MDTVENISSSFQVGDWLVEPDTGRLIKQGTEVKLEPKAMEVLVYLSQRPGNVISREELEDNVWSGMVVGYDSLSGSIIKLRKALGDNSRKPEYIETISKKGYRLIAPVSYKVEIEPSPDSDSQPVTSNRKPVFTGIALVTLIFLAVYLLNGPAQLGTFSPGTPSVLVIPFKNLSNDPQQEYFSNGITDDLITDLSRIESLRVIAPQTSYHFKNNSSGLQEIAQKLNVLYIVEGSVRKFGSQVRINVQLTNTEKNESIWAQRFDSGTDDFFRLQDDIIKQVMDAMLISISSGKKAHITERGTTNFEAYDAFLVGQQYINTRTQQGYDMAMNAYRRAIKIDPNYARGYGALAVTLTRGYRYKWTELSLVEARERALEMATKAVSLDKTTPQIHWSLGYVHTHRKEFDLAESATRKSITLSPNYADGYALLANISNWRGNSSEAIKYMEKAVTLNPYYTFQYPSTLGLAYYNAGRYQDAITTLKDALDRNENALNPRLFLAAAYTRLNQMDEAKWEIKQVLVNRPNTTLSDLGTILPFENTGLLSPLLDDLKKAGLPE